MFICLPLLGRQKSDNRFYALRSDEKIVIVDRKLNSQWVMPLSWLKESVDEFFEISVFDTLTVDIPYFKIKDRYVLIFSIFSSEGKFASGYDLLLMYNPENRSFSKQNLFDEPERGRGAGPCRGGRDIFYAISDINGDGNNDLGVVREYIQCDWEDDIPISRQYFLQKPIKWYTWNVAREQFTLQPNKKLVGGLQLISLMDYGPVDAMGKVFWKSYNPLKWKVRGEVQWWPPPRLQRSFEEAEKQNDQQMLARLKALR